MISRRCWPLRRGRGRRAQQLALPAVGFLHPGAVAANLVEVTAFRRGLGAQGYVENRNIEIAFRWAFGQNDQVPMLEYNLVDRPVAVIVVADATPETIKASQGIPVVFVTGDDPVKLGLVDNLDHPSGNATGATFLTNALGAKQLDLLRAVVPKARLIALVVRAGTDMTAYRAALTVNGQAALLLPVAAAADLDQAFAAAADGHADAVVIASDPFMRDQRDRLIGLAQRYRLPTLYPLREFVAAGGLMSYGASVADAFRVAGIDAGRILKGAAPGDLPVAQPTQIELIVNLETATALGLTLSPAFLARADEVL